MIWAKRIVFVLIALYLLVLALLFFAQRNLLYHPPQIYLTPEAVGLPDMTEVDIRIDDATIVTGWWQPPADGKPVIMFFHGNGSAVFSNHDVYSDLLAEGYGVWGVGYAGYPSRNGQSGKPSQESIVAAAKAQWQWLIDHGIADNRIVYFGTSLGTGVAAQLAKDNPPALFIAEAPFNSMLDMGRKLAPILPAKWLLKDQYRSDAALGHVSMPFIWIHGTQDEVVPLSQGRKLYEGYDGPKSEHVIQGGRHNNLWFLGGREIVLAALKG